MQLQRGKRACSKAGFYTGSVLCLHHWEVYCNLYRQYSQQFIFPIFFWASKSNINYNCWETPVSNYQEQWRAWCATIWNSFTWKLPAFTWWYSEFYFFMFVQTCKNNCPWSKHLHKNNLPLWLLKLILKCCPEELLYWQWAVLHLGQGRHLSTK